MIKSRFVFIVLMIFPIFVKGQKVELQLFGRTNCNDSIVKLNLYGATKDGIVYAAFDTIPIILPDTGFYLIETGFAEGDSIKIHINHYGLIRDTIVLSSIFDIAYTPRYPHFSGWLCCDKKCEGYQVDYYNNGNKRIEGSFRKGKAIGAVKYYNLNGTLSTIFRFDRHGNYIKREDF